MMADVMLKQLTLASPICRLPGVDWAVSKANKKKTAVVTYNCYITSTYSLLIGLVGSFNDIFIYVMYGLLTLSLVV